MDTHISAVETYDSPARRIEKEVEDENKKKERTDKRHENKMMRP